MKQIFGHDRIWQELCNAAVGGRLHHAWLLTGPEGVGKATLARQWALTLLAGTDHFVADDDPAARLFHAGTHPDYVELTRLERDTGERARNITVDQVRGLHRLLETSASISQRRIILVDSADDLERAGANALLKSLEEPPAGAVFILISHSPSRLLPTIRSRCRVVRLAPLADIDMTKALAGYDSTLDDAELTRLKNVGQGLPGRALSLAGLGVDSMIASLSSIATSGDRDNKERLALSKALSTKAARAKYHAFLEAVPHFLVQRARRERGHGLTQTIAAWENARRLSAGAIPLSLDPASVVFELATLVSALGAEQVS